MKEACCASDGNCYHLSSLFEGTCLYKLLTWQHKPLIQYPVLILTQVFFYLYLIRGWSLISMLSLYFLGAIFFRLIVAPAYTTEIPEGEQWVTEEHAKVLYVFFYTKFNAFVQYMRGIIQIQGGMKAVAKAAAFMYVSLVVNFIG